jgi:hypothetical protein
MFHVKGMRDPGLFGSPRCESSAGSGRWPPLAIGDSSAPGTRVDVCEGLRERPSVPLRVEDVVLPLARRIVGRLVEDICAVATGVFIVGVDVLDRTMTEAAGGAGSAARTRTRSPVASPYRTAIWIRWSPMISRVVKPKAAVSHSLATQTSRQPSSGMIIEGGIDWFWCTGALQGFT